MNAARRKSINTLVGRMQDIIDELIELKDEEQDYYDNMPQGLQEGDKGEAATENIDALEAAIGSLEDARSSAEEAAGE